MSARRRHEATPGRVLGVDADLDRVPEAPDVLLAQPERLPGCDPDLPGDEVEAGHQLRDGVLHLEPRVHLEEVELPVLEQELDGAGVLVAARPGDPHRRLAHGLTDVVGEVGGRALLDELLVAPLGGAVAFAEPQHVAVTVGHDLHLDVPGPREVALHVDLGPPEVGLSLALGRRQRLGRLAGSGDDLHPATAAAERRLDGDGPPVLLAEGHHLVGGGDRLGASGHPGHAGRLGGQP